MKGTVLVAGGTGLIGRSLVKHLKGLGYPVIVLSRSTVQKGTVHWDPVSKTVGVLDLQTISYVINLSGENIGVGRWTKSRKEALLRSRTDSTNFLFELSAQMPNLACYISASGINCYDSHQEGKIWQENDAYGDDYISGLVQAWERSSDQFKIKCRTVKLRTAVVLSKEGGALMQIASPIKFGFGAVLGKGTQYMQWIHIDDLVDAYGYALENALEGAFNTFSDTTTNKELTNEIARIYKKWLFLPNIPTLFVKLIFGEKSGLLLNGFLASNQKLRDTGFEFKYNNLSEALADCLKK